MRDPVRDFGQESVHSVGETLERTMMQTSVKMPATSICALVCTEKDVQLCVTFDQLVCLAKASAPNFQFGAQVPTGEDGKESLKGISHEVISFRFLDNCQVASVLVPEAEAAELPFQLHIQPSNSQTVKHLYTHRYHRYVYTPYPWHWILCTNASIYTDGSAAGYKKAEKGSNMSCISMIDIKNMSMYKL